MSKSSDEPFQRVEVITSVQRRRRWSVAEKVRLVEDAMQAASVLAEFLPVEPTETHATVRKRTIRIGERLDDQVAEEELHARAQTNAPA